MICMIVTFDIYQCLTVPNTVSKVTLTLVYNSAWKYDRLITKNPEYNKNFNAVFLVGTDRGDLLYLNTKTFTKSEINSFCNI